MLLIITSWWLLFRGAQRASTWLLSLVVVMVVTITLMPVGEWLLYPLESHFMPQLLPDRIDGIIILGGSEDAVGSGLWQQTELNEAAERNFAFLQLANRYPDARLFFTGGSGRLIQEEFNGADVAERLYREQGFDLSRITFERKSRNTYENVMLSREMAKPQSGERWLLITTAWHMPRSVGIFCQAGWPVIPYPVDHRSQPGQLLRLEFGFAGHLSLLNTAFREWLGLSVYYLTGKINALLPERCDNDLPPSM